MHWTNTQSQAKFVQGMRNAHAPIQIQLNIYNGAVTNTCLQMHSAFSTVARGIFDVFFESFVYSVASRALRNTLFGLKLFQWMTVRASHTLVYQINFITLLHKRQPVHENCYFIFAIIVAIEITPRCAPITYHTFALKVKMDVSLRFFRNDCNDWRNVSKMKQFDSISHPIYSVHF